MKYRAVLEDNQILKGHRVTDISRLTGVDHSYVSRVKRGKKIASEGFYKKLKKVLTK